MTVRAFSSALLAAVIASLLAIRLLSPAGFMPSFDHGRLTFVACPDAGFEAISAGPMHHHHGPATHHDPCPYAAASALGGLPVDFTILLEALVLAIALQLGRTFPFIERHERRLRPPLRGPPLTA